MAQAWDVFRMNPEKMLFFVLFFALMLLVVLGSGYWHEFAVERPLAEKYLAYYDASVPSGREACFGLVFRERASTGGEKTVSRLQVITNSAVVFDGEITPREEAREYCIPPGNLKTGANLVEVFVGSERLFFHAETGSEKTERFELPAVSGCGDCGSGAWPLFGTIFLMLLLAFVLYIFLSRTALLEAALFSLVFFSSAAIALPWLLNLFGVPLAFQTVFGSIAIASVLLFLLYKPGWKACLDANRRREPDAKKFLICFLAFGILLALLHLPTPSHFNNWNVFYERYSEMVVRNNGIPASDPLGYLGRGFTFVWGYFLFNSSLSFITGLQGTALFALVYFMVNALFFLSALYFLRSFRGFGLEHGIIFYLLLMSSLFIFVNAMLSPKHILSFAFLFVAVGMLLRNKNPLLVGSAVAMAAFTQASFLLLFPITAVAVSRVLRWKSLAVAVLSSLVIFLVLFSPILLQNGLPYEVSSEAWGYLIKHNPADLLVDLGQVVALLFLCMLFRVLVKWKTLDGYTKKLFYCAILLVLVQVLVFYRINIVTHLVLALLLFNVFRAELSQKYFRYMIAALCIISILANLVIVSYTAMWGQQLAPLEFLAKYTLPGDRVLADPFYAHLETYFAGRPVLADLYVEYADAQKLDDAYDFILDENPAVLEKYGIRYTLTENDRIFADAKNLHYFPSPKEFGFMDKIYGNGYFSVHRAR